MCARGEMDIMTGFGPVVVGSNPAGRTKVRGILENYMWPQKIYDIVQFVKMRP